MNDDIIKENYLKFKALKDSKNKPSKGGWYLNSKHITKEEKEYLKTRWKDADTLAESLYRIVYDIKERPVCPVCGKFTEFVNKNDQIYRRYCSWECKKKNTDLVERHRQGCLRKYGVENISQVPGNRDKFAKTMMERYGHPNNFGRPEVAKSIFEKYGVDSPGKIPGIYEKMVATMKMRGNYGKFISKAELKIYNKLKEFYPNIIHQYKDKIRYPFMCDYYIPELDLFLEYQGYWAHGGHPFDPNSKEDLELVETWKNKGLALKEKHSPNEGYYDGGIKVWTIKDPLKRETAKNNNLNYLEIWPDWSFEKTLEEIKKFDI